MVYQSARIVYNDFSRTSSVTSMLNNLNWPPLEQRRRIGKAIMLFKIINNLVAVPHDHISKFSASTHGHNMKYIQLAVHITPSPS